MPLIDFILHIDQHLKEFINQYGTWVYAAIFLIIFCETGLVFMPFLPGDNLLFAAGALAAIGQLDPWLISGVLGSAAIIGDSTNYWIGRKYGTRLFSETRRFPSRKHLATAEAFFQKHGGKSVLIGRFMPFIRTFTPFVAGMSTMPYLRFLAFSVSGTILWVGTLVPAGYFLGQLPFVKENLTLIVLIIIGLSLLPLFIQGARHYLAKRRSNT
ncbi:DedA family protein [Aquirhabdus parva]|uniref:DedA family protein n=1 Tax=Aquirhabdus parva TaxID=2283318 RepID=A0A345P6I4_9GAMM|nr:DedA family protein [Aquirhabdus parva]AXI02893.1 DedA family protein [Aquirhabdus parva]